MKKAIKYEGLLLFNGVTLQLSTKQNKVDIQSLAIKITVKTLKVLKKIAPDYKFLAYSTELLASDRENIHTFNIYLYFKYKKCLELPMENTTLDEEKIRKIIKRNVKEALHQAPLDCYSTVIVKQIKWKNYDRSRKIRKRKTLTS